MIQVTDKSRSKWVNYVFLGLYICHLPTLPTLGGCIFLAPLSFS